MTLPTKITVLRMILTCVIMGLLFAAGWVAKAMALALFLLASLTDWLDGYVARRWRQVSPLGALLDPIADKVLVLGVFLAFVQLRLVPAWMVLIMLCRELLITGVRLVAASHDIVLSAAKEGKHKTVSQMLTILLILTSLVVRARLDPQTNGALDLWLTRTIAISLWLTVVLTVVSGVSFFWRHRTVLRDAVGR